MSTRAIGSALGVSKGTVVHDLAGGIGQNYPMPERIATTDGRTYPATRELVIVGEPEARMHR